MEGKEEDNSLSQQQFKNKLRWTDQLEDVLISWADKAIVYKILHEKAYKLNKLKNYAFTIPCVCLSTILASATFALSGDSKLIPDDTMTFAQYGLGGVNIIIGILQTLQNFFKYAQMSEAHDSVSKQWYKLYRMINTELNIARNKRKDADEFMKYCRLEFDRLIDLSPDIPDKIIKAFKENYLKKMDKEITNESNRGKISPTVAEDMLDLPDICGIVYHTRAYRFEDKEELPVEPPKKEDPFEKLVQKITNQMAATSYVLGATGGGDLESYPSTTATSPNTINNPEIKIDIQEPSATDLEFPLSISNNDVDKKTE